MTARGAILVTGASTGIGAVYADRFAARGHDLVLVARDADRLGTLAAKLSERHGISAEVLAADLAAPEGMAAVERRIAEHPALVGLVNNAGVAEAGGFIDQQALAQERMIAINVVAVMQLARAAATRFAAAGDGFIVNVGSIVCFQPELGMAVYGASKLFVLHFSQALAAELAPHGVFVQAMIPGPTLTEIWQRSGIDPAGRTVMDPEDLVDAALVGFERRETVTIPHLPDAADWEGLETARKAMVATLQQQFPGPRYGIARGGRRSAPPAPNGDLR